MTSWFRSWHGAPTDSKWLVIAKRANVAPGMVSAVFWALLDTASQADERGSVADFDAETYALWAGFEEHQICAVIDAMRAKGVIDADGRLIVKQRYLEPEVSRTSTEEWTQLRNVVFKRDAYTCRYCGKQGGKLECDHVTPASRGGSDDISNLVTACRKCNRSKRDKTPEEWKR